MKKLSLMSIALFTSMFVQNSFAFDKAEVRSIVNALFSHNEQREASAKADISSFVNLLHEEVFQNGQGYWRYSTREGAIKIIDESVKWVSTKAYRKSYSLMCGAYRQYFPNVRTIMSEQEQVAKYVVARVRSRAGSLVSRVRNEVSYLYGNPNATAIVNIVKSSLRTYVGSDLDSKVIAEIDSALNATCSICLMQESVFLAELQCGHWVHRPCYSTWRQTRFNDHLDVTCPFCRATVEPYQRYQFVPVSPVLTGLHFSVDLNNGNALFSFSIN